MTTEAEQIAQLLTGKSRVTPLVGSFVEAGIAAWTVDTGGGRIPNCIPMTPYLPEVGEDLWVLWIDGTPYVTGPSKTKPSQGVVMTVSGNIVTLQTDLGDVRAPYGGTTAPSSGEVWKLFAVARMSISPSQPAPPPAPGAGPILHEDIFTAIDAGSYGGGKWWTSQVWAADSSLGAWFYGSKIKDTLSAAAAIQTVETYVSPASVSGASPNFATHGNLTRPAGPPAFGSSYPTAIAPQWVQLSNDIGNALKTGGPSGGVGINQGGYSSFRSLAEDGQSGALRIRSIY